MYVMRAMKQQTANLFYNIGTVSLLKHLVNNITSHFLKKSIGYLVMITVIFEDSKYVNVMVKAIEKWHS